MNKDNALDKNDVVSKLNEELCDLDKHFKVRKNGNDLILYFYGKYRVIPICWFADFKTTKFYAPKLDGQVDCWLMTALVMTGVAHRFYKKGIELLENYELRYTIHIIKNSEDGFLNYDSLNKVCFLSDNKQGKIYKAQFTMNEINNMKSSRNLAIDWDKAIIKEVKENEND